MTAAHILVCLTNEGKSHEEIAREDFNNNNNKELVTVCIDYMAAINWICKDTNNNGSNDKWLATDSRRKWVKK